MHLQGGLSVARTAEALFLHRNTVRYRLGQIERLTARRLDVLEDRLVLEIGVVAARLAP